MGFEMGFVDQHDDNTCYWFLCGWENLDFYHDFASICGAGKNKDRDEETIVPVKNLDFICPLTDQLFENKIYNIYRKVLLVDSFLAQDYLESLSIEDKIDFATAFALPQDYSKYQTLANHFYENVREGILIVDSFKEAYDRMKKETDTVVLYGG